MTRINRWAALCMAIVFLTISLAAASARIQNEKSKSDPPDSPDSSKVTGPSDGQTDSPKALEAAKSFAENTLKETTVSGQVTDLNGKPLVDAHVAIVGLPNLTLFEARDLPLSNVSAILAQTKTDDRGKFRVLVSGLTSANYFGARAAFGKEGYGLEIKHLGLDADAREINAQLAPDVKKHYRILSSFGEPVRDVTVKICSVSKTDQKKVMKWLGICFPDQIKPLSFWPVSTKTDQDGRFSVSGTSQDYQVDMKIFDDRFAQEINYSKPEGEEKVITLTVSPSRPLEGDVFYADSRKPAANARLLLASFDSNNRSGHTVTAQTDGNGHFKAILDDRNSVNVIAYPPKGEAYLVSQQSFENRPAKIEVALSRGIMVRGKIVEATSGIAVPQADIRYEPSQWPSKDQIASGDFTTVLSDSQGEFQIAVRPGKGALFVQGPQNDYIARETTEGELTGKKPNGSRYRASAIVPLDLMSESKPDVLNVTLQRGVTVKGKIVGPDNRTIEEAIMFSTLYPLLNRRQNQILSVGIYNGQFELHGLDPDKSVSVYFLDRINKLGAKVEVSGKSGENGPLVVRLEPCGKAVASFVDSEGIPKANYRPWLTFLLTPGVPVGNLSQKGIAADEEYVANIDHVNYDHNRMTDAEGRYECPALIPGMTYHINLYRDQNRWDGKEFTVKSGETLQLSDIQVEKTPYAIQRRTVNKLVKDFQEETDLSTPEAIVVAVHCYAINNIQDIEKLSWTNLPKHSGRIDVKKLGLVDLKEIEDWCRNNPNVSKNLDKFMFMNILESEIVKVLIYREDLAEVIYKSRTPLPGPDYPYRAFFIGKINGLWKILAMNQVSASSDIEDFEKDFEQNKEIQWNLFQQVKKDIGGDINGKSDVALRALPPDDKKATPAEQKRDVKKPAAIRATLDQVQRDSRKWEVIRLKAVDPQSAVLSINKMFGISSDAKTAPAGVPKIDADITKRQMLIHGTEEQIAQIRQLLVKMGESDIGRPDADDESGAVSPRSAPAISDQTQGNSPAAIQHREINKLVKDFPEKADLSTPESALAAYHRATAKKDAKTVLELSWRKYYAHDIEEMERFFKSDSSKDMEIFLQALLDAEVIEVITYRDDFAQVVSKLKFPEGFGKDPYTSRSFGRINGQWKNLGEDRLPSIEAVRESFERKKDNLWKDFLEVKDIATGKKPDPKQSNEIKLPPEKYAEAKAATPESERLILMGLVENFFVHNARNITARKTLAWGEIKKNENGGRSIRYKFEARIWDKETMIADQIFTFDKDNVILSCKDADGPPVKKEPKKVDVNSQKGMKDLVEDFFENNFRDFTSRKTIEWGDVEKDADGNSSIRYKYEATIWEKNIQIMNQIFTFDEKGEFVRFKNIEGFPQKVEDKAKESQSPPSNKSVNASPEEINKQWSWLFGEPRLSSENLVPLKYAEACLQVAKAELEVSQEANRRVPGSVPMVNIKKLELERDSSVLKVQYFQAALKGDEKAIQEIARQYAKANVDCLQSELDISLEANRRVPGSVPTLMIEQMQLKIDLAKLDLETVEAKARGDENASRELATRRAEIEAKLKPSPEEIHKRWSWLFGESKFISEKLLRENLEFDNAQIKKSQEANRKVPGTIPLINIQNEELVRDIHALMLQHYQAAQKGDEKAIQEIARRYAKAIVDYSQIELDAYKQANQRQPGAFSNDWIQQYQLDFDLAKLKLESVEAQLKGDEKASRELATRRAEVEAKRKAVEAKERDDEKASQ